MACCIVAAFLYAQLKAVLWRWAAYWGLARVPDGIDYDTVYVRLANRARRGRVRAGQGAHEAKRRDPASLHVR